VPEMGRITGKIESVSNIPGVSWENRHRVVAIARNGQVRFRHAELTFGCPLAVNRTLRRIL